MSKKSIKKKLKNNRKVIATQELSAVQLKYNEESFGYLSELNKKIVDNVPVSIIIIDKNGIIKFVNKFYKNISEDINAVGKNIFKIPFFIKENLCEDYKNLLELGAYFNRKGCRTQNEKREIKYINIVAVPMKNKMGKIDGCLSIALDATESFLARDKLEKLNRDLEAKVKERTRQLDETNIALSHSLDARKKFIADASHELRTPLTIINGSLYLIEKDLEEKNVEVPDFFKTINEEVDKISLILTDLSLLAKIDGAQERLKLSDVNLNDLIKNIIKELKILADQDKISLQFQDYKDEPIIKADKNKLEKLISNIIRNAIKYNKKGGWVKIWLELNSANKTVKINISDSGMGIPEKDLPHIFDRFYRTDYSRNKGDGGFGLGLAICKWIAEMHKGLITVKTRINKGSIFTISLPVELNEE